MSSEFRNHLFPQGHRRLAGLDRHDAYSYADALRNAPRVGDALRDWLELFDTTTFTGVTADGVGDSDLFDLGADEGAPTSEAMTAARVLLDNSSSQQRDHLVHPIGSKVWRAWMNPEIYLNRFGLRLEELDTTTRQLAMNLVKASVSADGYRKIRDVMGMNEFLGELVGLPRILNEYSYNINLFGTPSLDQPWGWNLYGHHLSVNCLFIGRQQVLTPVFFGAEPTSIDAGGGSGTVLFAEQEELSLALIRSLPDHLTERAILFHHKRDPLLPPGRLHPADELHLGGAFQDNRIIPFEGLPVAECDSAWKEQLVRLLELFVSYQPDGPRSARLTAIRRHLDTTWFCWIGGVGDDDPFYYRIQSPVLLVEFDHHAGVFLANREPERFHVHTVLRTPNGNDYGVHLVRRATGAAHRLDGPA